MGQEQKLNKKIFSFVKEHFWHSIWYFMLLVLLLIYILVPHNPEKTKITLDNTVSFAFLFFGMLLFLPVIKDFLAFFLSSIKSIEVGQYKIMLAEKQQENMLLQDELFEKQLNENKQRVIKNVQSST